MGFRSIFLILLIHQAASLIPPKFQWKTIDFAWESKEARQAAIDDKTYIPENVMPTGLMRWKNKLFITIPRWKKGIPSSLNYIHLNGSQQNQLLNPYPTWKEASVSHNYCCVSHNSTVVSGSRMYVDRCNRLWVVDNGVSDMSNKEDVKHISPPAVMIFDLNSDTLLQRYVLAEDVVRNSSVFSSIVVDITAGKVKNTTNTFAYITDTGSNAIIVYSLNDKTAWRVDNPFFGFDRTAVQYKVGGVAFNMTDGISGAALAHTKRDGYRDLYFAPTSSIKQFRISTKLLRNRTVSPEELFNNVEVVGEREPKSQSTACDFDAKNNILFYTQVNKNGVGCWNIDKPFNGDNNPVIMSDCFMLEYPNDIKVDSEGNLWMLSNRQARFLNDSMDFTQVNFRVLSAPVTSFIKGTTCEKMSKICKAFSCIKSQSAKSCESKPCS